MLRQATWVRLQVTDSSPQFPCRLAELLPEAERGRGLVTVEAVADKWGVGPVRDGGKVVWFECWCGKTSGC